MTTSPNKSKQKLSLRKRLFVKKSPKVGCYVDTDSNDEFTQSTSRPISPVDPFIAQSAYNLERALDKSDNCMNKFDNNISVESDTKQDSSREDDNHPKCCRTLFKKSRPRSLIEGSSFKKDSSDPTSPVCSSNNLINNDNDKVKNVFKSDEIPKATIKFPKNDDPRKYFEHSGSFEGIKSKNKMLVKRLSADHLMTNDTKPFCRSSSPESDRSNSLDRKRRYYN